MGGFAPGPHNTNYHYHCWRRRRRAFAGPNSVRSPVSCPARGQTSQRGACQAGG
ncbi:Hypothetical predicted protein [Olea europaea subsp. europaea]|uniref:Uncharacterized protein n=1 Tax=Olea europaea subsp. europaea TaxID=158383 RepID=A0A8S0RBR6_OLEEU|nr:Hypothetical predicted protein [Olea europaea subsp. europaea]